MARSVQESQRDKLQAFAEVMRCELGSGYAKYELDEYEMILLMDGIKATLSEIDRLRLKLEIIAAQATQAVEGH